MTDRPAWPYAIGAIGAIAFTLGVAALLYASAGSPTKSAGDLAVGGLGIGGGLLGIGWLGVFKQKQCGFGVIASSFALPLAFIYIYMHRDDWELFRADGMMIMLALAFFASAHVFVRKGWLRNLSALTALGLWAEILMDAAKVHVEPDTARALAVTTELLLLGVGLAIAGTLAALHREQPPSEQL